MAVKTPFSHDDFIIFFSQYALGEVLHASAIPQGTVQTNYVVQTTTEKLVLRYYENRPRESVLFECHLLAHLTTRGYPCPAPLANRRGEYVGAHRGKPFVVFEFLPGEHIEHPTAQHQQQLIQRAAELHNLTWGYQPPCAEHRWNYSADLCRTLARREANRIDTPDAHAKFAWLDAQLAQLQLPPDLPKGICHCDFHFSNILFQGDQFAALLDFDDANYTYLLFDLVGLIETWAWPHTSDGLDFDRVREVVQAYMQHRPLSEMEQRHLFDVYELSILIDCVWFFERGGPEGFYEKRKIEFLQGVGREAFFAGLFAG